MSSNNLSLEDGSLDDAFEVLSNKETQTSTAYITDSIALIKGPSRPLPKCIDKSDVEGIADKNILDCRVIKDPSDSKQIVLTESFIKDVANVSNSEVSESPRQSYCKEVVTPYLKPHLNDCEDNVDSLEKRIQEALEEFPDYQPCHEVYEGEKDIQQKTSDRTTKTKKMAIKPKTENEQDTPGKSSPTVNQSQKKAADQPIPLSSHSSSSNINKNKKKSTYSDNPQLPTVIADEINDNDDIHTTISAESIAKCVQESLTALKRTASTCLEKIEIVIGIKKPENPGEKPTYYAMEKPKVESVVSNNVQTETGNSLKNLKNLLNEHNEKITTIKETVKDLAGKFYQTSKDAVTLITSESAKLLSKDKSEAHSEENTAKSQPEPKEKKLRKISADSITSFFFKKAETKPIKNEPPKIEAPPESSVPNASAPSLSSHLMSKITDSIDKKMDKSSPYDKPLPKEVPNKKETTESRIPTVSAIDHTPDPPSASNMFIFIKSKIFSIFRDDTEADAVQEDEDEEEEDPFERFMEQ